MSALRSAPCHGVFSSRVPSVRPASVRTTRVITASYKNLENVDLSRVAAQQRHEKDTGSSEVQVARLSARIVQVAAHLKINRKDYSASRGLQAILNDRKTHLLYLYKHNRDTYDRVVKDFGIRSVIVGDTRGATRKDDTLDKSS